MILYLLLRGERLNSHNCQEIGSFVKLPNHVETFSSLVFVGFVSMKEIGESFNILLDVTVINVCLECTFTMIVVYAFAECVLQ